jgi:diadenosine tetraphosphate (Ap4A) HIT family hydrolase
MTLMTKVAKGRKVNLCSFCGKGANDQLHLIAGQDGSSICTECVALCVEIHEDQKWALTLGPGPAPSPTSAAEQTPALGRIGATWRGEYVEQAAVVERAAAKTGLTGDCVFCDSFAAPDDDAGLVVHRGVTASIVLNKYPYSSGHVLVLPHQHVGALSDLEDGEQADLWSLVSKCSEVVQRAYQPDGMNIGVNLGRAAGAGLPAHLHVHILPRWSGDTNFMTTIGNVRVVSESLDVTLRKLRAAWT